MRKLILKPQRRKPKFIVVDKGRNLVSNPVNERFAAFAIQKIVRLKQSLLREVIIKTDEKKD